MTINWAKTKLQDLDDMDGANQIWVALQISQYTYTIWR